MKTVLNIGNPNNRSNKLFFGEKIGICNFADMKYPVFKTLYDKQLGFFWRPTEISCATDAVDIRNMNETQRFIFESNLAFQTMGDSFLGRGIEGILEHVTNNEFYQTLKVHAFFEESIHTPSYSHIFENIYNNPSEKFYGILEDKHILARATESTDTFNKLLNNPDSDARIDVINTMVGLLSLESIAFFNSFLTSFYFAKNGLMTGCGKIIKLICRDESLHRSNIINGLNILRSKKDEGFMDMKDQINDKISETFLMVANQEIEWSKHLFSKGELTGFNQKGVERYVKFLTNKSLRDVGIKDKLFEDVKNPFPWVDSFQSSSKSTQVAPQESEITGYVKSSKNDLDEMNFDY